MLKTLIHNPSPLAKSAPGEGGKQVIKSGLFIYLLILTGLFILLEISFFIQGSELYLGDYKLVALHIKIPMMVIPGILFFIFAQSLVHLCYTTLVWGMARLMSIALNCSWKQTQVLGFSLWVLGLITILLMNQYFFPLSKFSDLMKTFVPFAVAKILLIILLLLIFAAILLALVGLFFLAARKFILISGIVIVGMVVAVDNLWPSTSLPHSAATPDQPNIFLISMDALRPDFLSYFGYSRKTPHLDKVLNNSTVFAEAYTPLARTFPAWVSILTGQYPKETGMRSVLADQEGLNLQETLPAILQRQGYETIFATDETRFSNIGKNFGFDKVLGPPMGFNDFLLGTLNDFPISNLLVNTKLGKWLFPHSYANRSVYTTYQPNTFLKFLQPTLEESHTKPLFLATHFCLPHFPYFWGEYRLTDNKALTHYQAALKRVDKQVGKFLSMLKQNHLLDHSIVVLLSDHGEALELSGDRVTDPKLFIPGANNKKGIVPYFYPPTFDFEKVNQSAGHGTDVLGLTQYRSVLAFRLFGTKSMNQAHVVQNRVSLLDIKPTILGLLNLPHQQGSGESLVNFIIPESLNAAPLQKHFFIESDFSPTAVRSVHPEARKVLFAGIDFFRIDPTTAHIVTKKSMLDMIISSKQYADFYGPWVLALYPKDLKSMTTILVNLETRQWTNDLSTHFAKNSPADSMLLALKQFYGKEITSVSEN